MAYDKNDKDFVGILSLALGEAQDARQLHAGTDHIFLALMQQRYAVTNVVLMKYEDQIDAVRRIVRASTTPQRFSKYRRVRMATSSISFMAAGDLSTIIWNETHEQTMAPSALSVLEAILEIGEPRLIKILDYLHIDRDMMLLEVRLRREVTVEN